MDIKSKSKKKILILVDQPNDNLDKWLAGPTPGNSQLDLLTFDCSPSQIKTGSKINILETKEISAQAEQEAREFYIKLIKELPDYKINGRSVAELLAWKKRNLWWYLEISEKSIWLDRTVHRLYALSRLAKVCQLEQYDQVLIFAHDRLLSKAIVEYAGNNKLNCSVMVKHKKEAASFIIKYAAGTLRLFIKMGLQLVLYNLFRIKNEKAIAAKSLAFFSVYPSWWQNPFSGEAKDKFFQDIPNQLAKTERVYDLIWVRPGWRTFFSRRQGFRQFLKGRQAIILNRYLKIVDLFKLFSLKRLVSFTKVLNWSAKADIKYKGINISFFIHQELSSSLASVSLFEWLLMDNSLRRFPLEQFRAVFFRLEFQPLERALLYNAPGRTTTFGFQHSALSRNFLNYAFADGQLADSKMPLPNYILTSGPKGYSYMKKAGFPQDKLVVVGAIRQSYLFKHMNQPPAKEALRRKYSLPLDKKIVFVATTALFDETISMIHDLLQAVSRDQARYHLMIKCHPNVRALPSFVPKIKELFKQHGGNYSYDIFIERNIPLHDYLLLADTVLSTGGTVSLESMFLGGAETIVYNCLFQFNHSPLLDYPEAVVIAKDLNSMAAALNTEWSEVMRAKQQQPLSDMFGDITQDPQQKFISTIKNITGGIK